MLQEAEDEMSWKIVHVDDGDPSATWTDSELVGVSVLLTHRAGEPYDESNVYWRARERMQPQVEIALTGWEKHNAL